MLNLPDNSPASDFVVGSTNTHTKGFRSGNTASTKPDNTMNMRDTIGTTSKPTITALVNY
jgi:hypothetical protein